MKNEICNVSISTEKFLFASDARSVVARIFKKKIHNVLFSLNAVKPYKRRDSFPLNIICELK